MKKNILWAIFMVAFSSFFASPFFKNKVFYAAVDPEYLPQDDTVYIYLSLHIKNGILEDRLDMESRDFEILKIEEKGDSLVLIRLHQPVVEIMELENGKMVLKEQKAHWIPETIIMHKTKKKYIWAVYTHYSDGKKYANINEMLKKRTPYRHVIDSADVMRSKYPVDVIAHWLDDVDCGDCDKTIKWP